MPNPLAIVTDINDIVVDPANPTTHTVFTITVKLLFCGPVPLEEQCSASVLNTATKAQIKTALNNAIEAAVVAQGFSIGPSRILTIADIAG